MCGRFVQLIDLIDIIKTFGIEEVEDEPVLSFNVAPTQGIGVILQDGKRVLKKFRWGLVTPWSYGSHKYSLINIRAESLFEKKTFQKNLKGNRCIIYADGFYEWKETPSGKEPEFIKFKSGKPMAFAGLWQRFEPKDGSPLIESAAIITTTANELIAEFHDRMPVILPENLWETWLNTEEFGPDVARELLVPYPGQDMQYYPVSKKMNKPEFNNADCIKPLEEN